MKPERPEKAFDETAAPHAETIASRDVSRPSLEGFDPTLGLREVYTSNDEVYARAQALPEISLEEPGALTAGRGLPSVGGEGRALPDLKLLELLGEGGMGQVWLAEQRSLSRQVAVKSVKPGHRSGALHALLHEGTVMGSMAHPSIVPVHALGRDGVGRPVLVMERVQGASWRDLMRDPEHPQWPSELASLDALERHLEIFKDVCNAVAYAHSRGILHRDIKPANVMLGEYGEVLLLDWGLAVMLAEGQEARVGRGSEPGGHVVGTPSYMAPEMLSGERDVLGAQTDVYLLGAVLYEILVGHPPHQGENLVQVLAEVEASEVSGFAEDIPEELIAICKRATSLDPDARYPSAMALRDAVTTHQQRGTSRRLAQSAREHVERLLALRGDAPRDALVERDATIRETAAAGLFGCEEALREWRGNTVAHALRETLNTELLGHELDMRHPESAEALLAKLHDPPDGAPERIASLREELEAERRARAELEHVRAEMDFAGAAPLPRLRFFWMFGAVIALVGAAAGPFVGSLEGSDKLLGMLAMDGFVTLAVTLGIFWKRKVLLARRINRQIFSLAIVLVTSVVFMRVISLALAQTVAESTTVGLAALSVLAVAAGVTVVREILVVLPATLIALMCVLRWPEYAAEIHSLASLVGWALFMVVLMRLRHQQGVRG